jgi:hypothetical protein
MLIGGSTDDGESASGGECVEGVLHDAAHVGVGLVDVGVLAELRNDVDRR